MTLSTSGTRLTAKGMATRARIVDAASDLMLERGVARTTIEDIQETAGVSASQLYHYFTDKNDLVLAVIDHQSDLVLGIHQESLDRLDSFAALEVWRDKVIDVVRATHCAGGCPLGSLASDLAETDPIARARLARAFGLWEELLRVGLAAMRERGELRPDTPTDDLALAMLAGLQGGLLLSQIRRDTQPIEVAIDTAIAHLRTMRP
ncbi:MAG TPA: TetR family transcriptional regulator [Pseudonocardiaceae bacterium]